jgi:hypothetical protein
VLDEVTEELWESWPPAHMWIVWASIWASTSKAQADIVREYIPIDILIARKKVSIIKLIFCGQYKLARTDLLFRRLQLEK